MKVSYCYKTLAAAIDITNKNNKAISQQLTLREGEDFIALTAELGTIQHYNGIIFIPSKLYSGTHVSIYIPPIFFENFEDMRMMELEV